MALFHPTIWEWESSETWLSSQLRRLDKVLSSAALNHLRNRELTYPRSKTMMSTSRIGAPKPFPRSSESLLQIVSYHLPSHFRQLVELTGLWRRFLSENEKVKTVNIRKFSDSRLKEINRYSCGISLGFLCREFIVSMVWTNLKGCPLRRGFHVQGLPGSRIVSA